MAFAVFIFLIPAAALVSLGPDYAISELAFAHEEAEEPPPKPPPQLEDTGTLPPQPEPVPEQALKSGDDEADEPCPRSKVATEVTPQGQVRFDCSVGQTHWQLRWSELQKQFCCQQIGIGCSHEGSGSKVPEDNILVFGSPAPAPAPARAGSATAGQADDVASPVPCDQDSPQPSTAAAAPETPAAITAANTAAAAAAAAAQPPMAAAAAAAAAAAQPPMTQTSSTTTASTTTSSRPSTTHASSTTTTTAARPTTSKTVTAPNAAAAMAAAAAAAAAAQPPMTRKSSTTTSRPSTTHASSTTKATTTTEAILELPVAQSATTEPCAQHASITTTTTEAALEIDAANNTVLPFAAPCAARQPLLRRTTATTTEAEPETSVATNAVKPCAQQASSTTTTTEAEPWLSVATNVVKPCAQHASITTTTTEAEPETSVAINALKPCAKHASITTTTTEAVQPCAKHASITADQQEPPEIAGGLPVWELAWEDEFNATSCILDTHGIFRPSPEFWTCEEGYQRGYLQWYTADNVQCNDGNLVITSKPQKTYSETASCKSFSEDLSDADCSICGPPYFDNEAPACRMLARNGSLACDCAASAQYSSGSVMTKDKKEFSYGLFEMKAKIDTRAGARPSWWAVGDDFRQTWPGNGEIDIIDAFQNRVKASVYHAKNTAAGLAPAKHEAARAIDQDWEDHWHVWQMEWDEHFIVMRIDSQEIFRLDLTQAEQEDWSNNPFINGKPFSMIVNLAMGKNRTTAGEYPCDPVTLQVDYIRSYTKKEVTA